MKATIAMAAVLMMAGAAMGQATRPSTGPASAPAKPPAKVVYLLDASGVLATRYEAMVSEIELAIGELKPGQAFTVVVARQESFTAMDGAVTMGPPTAARKAKAGKFMRAIEPTGFDGLPAAIPAILKVRPDAVWLISDGNFGKREGTIAAFKNAKELKVNTTTKFTDSPNLAMLLQKISEQSGGVCTDKDGKPVMPKARSQTRPSGPSVLR